MKHMIAAGLFLASTLASAASIPMYNFPVKNGRTTNETYKMSEHKNAVFVFEAYRLSCSYCNENAANVDALTTEFAAEPRVQVLDLGLDTNNADYAEWISRHKPNHPVIQDVGRKVYNALHTENGIPQVFVVNCKGEMIGNVVGTWPGNEKDIHDAITAGLQTTCP